MRYNLIILTLLLLIMSKLKSQESLYSVIQKHIQLEHNDLVTKNKLLGVSFISKSPTTEEWEELKELNRTLEVFKYAKLKGGESGINWVLVCDDYSESLQVELKQHGILNPFLLNCSFDAGMEKSGYNFQNVNVLFDKDGLLLNTRVPSQEIFNIIHTKIIR
jgi:hypothetical protein